MIRKRKWLLILACLAFQGRFCWGQQWFPSQAPPTSVPRPSLPASQGPAVTLAPPTPVTNSPPCTVYEDCNGPLLKGDPLLDRPDYPPPGWFGALDIGFLKPHVKNALVAPVTVGGITTSVQLPSAELDWTGSPRVEVGYRFSEGFGEVLVSYQALFSEGNGTLHHFDAGGAGSSKSRLDVNAGDIDYSSREYSLGQDWDMKWQAGVRVAGVFFDSRAVGQTKEERTSNNFVGAGPHLVLDLNRKLPIPNLAVFSQVESSLVVGEITQAFEENLLVNGTPVLGGTTNQEMTQAVPMVNGQLGVSWTPVWASNNFRVSTGYEFEQWWYLGEVNSSRGSLTVQGLFLRGEWDF